jgi:hypothetical protein
MYICDLGPDIKIRYKVTLKMKYVLTYNSTTDTLLKVDYAH